MVGNEKESEKLSNFICIYRYHNTIRIRKINNIFLQQNESLAMVGNEKESEKLSKNIYISLNHNTVSFQKLITFFYSKMQFWQW